MKPSPGRVVVEAPARLHFGMLDLRGELGRRYGGIGASVASPSTRLVLRAARELWVTGDDSARVSELAQRCLEYFGIDGSTRIEIVHAIPQHAGLGSGTQLALAVARGLTELYGIDATVLELARAMGRARRSGVGTWTFEHGGFVLEGGKAAGDTEPAPLLARHTMPAEWRCIIAIPDAEPGMSGDTEAEAFAALPPPPRAEVEHVAHLVLMTILPALARADLQAFGSALTEVQCVTGRWFAPVQGGAFAPGETTTLIRTLLELGATGVGQSSWGPSVYAIAANHDAARALADRCRAIAADSTTVFITPFDAHGARVTHE